MISPNWIPNRIEPPCSIQQLDVSVNGTGIDSSWTASPPFSATSVPRECSFQESLSGGDDRRWEDLPQGQTAYPERFPGPEAGEGDLAARRYFNKSEFGPMVLRDKSIVPAQGALMDGMKKIYGPIHLSV